MKIRKWGLGLLAAAVFSLSGVSAVAAAQNNTETGKGKVVNSTVYRAGSSVVIEGVINGDVFCAGQTVEIDATVHGDVICGGQQVTIAGRVDGDVRVAGQRVDISADIRRSVTVAAESFSLDAVAKVGQDLTATGGLANVKGSVGRDATLSSSRTILNGFVARNVTYSGAALELRSNAHIQGGLTYSSKAEMKKDAEATVDGTTRHNQPHESERGMLGFSFAWYSFALLSLLLVGLAISLIAPRTLHSMSDIIVQQWTKPLIAGIIAGFVIPIVAIAIAVTVVGIPLALMLFAGWFMLMMLSGPVVGYYVGRLLLPRQHNIPLRALAGGAILITLYFLPLIGFLALLAAYWLGSGAVLLAIKRRLGKPRYSLSKA